MNKGETHRRLLIIPLAVGAFIALSGLLEVWSPLELGVYDIFLHLKPSVKEDKSIVLLNVDEEAIARVGSWPWPRGLMARGLETLAEVNAGYAIFDIEYLQKSPMSVDRTYLEGGLKSEFDGLFDEVGSNVGGLFNAIASGSIPLKDAGDYGNQLVELIDENKKDLYKKTGLVAMENDSYMGKAMRLFGHSFITLNIQSAKVADTPPELREFAQKNFSYPKIQTKNLAKSDAVDFLVPIPEVSHLATNAGFTNVKIDPDGVRRRIRLVEEIEGRSYLQLAFSPLMREFGEPEIIAEHSRIILKGAMLKGVKTDITIPLDPQGYMMLRWPKKKYIDSFTPYISFYRLLEYRDHEDELVANLRTLRAVESWALVNGPNPVDAPLQAWKTAEDGRRKALDSGKPEDRATWLANKVAFKKAVAVFLAAGWDVKMDSLLDQVRAAAAKADAPLYDAFKKRFGDIYRNCSTASSIIDSEEKLLRDRLTGAFCIIGWTASATTDIGANPFDPEYVNVGTHAAVLNTIIQRDFLRELPSWVGSIIAFLLSITVILAIQKLKTNQQILVGLGATAVVFLVCYLFFHVWGIHIPTIAPTLATFLSFLSYALASFLMAEREKSFLRKAFGTYLSGDVINEIIANPDMLKLGGQKKWITAMFTDVRGFSTVSEALDPEQLVKLLNLYLSGMSDIILEHKGTIDKFEGDAIISFYGAPLPYEMHAKAACLSAIMMKKKEAELNVQFLADGLTPTPLLTRIGLNTGDMVVGNMGTERKMDYTIMGNAVNLAARLEGVNKQYGSWILATDATKTEAGDEFITRRFDRVRVVGIHTPVQLWEIIGLKADMDSAYLEFLDRFEKAHQIYDTMDWKKATELFGALAGERPEDGPSTAYFLRSKGFLAKNPAADWDGVINLSEK